MTHTPGPWIYGPNMLDSRYWAITSPTGVVIAEATMKEDNARLIAAAPDLLEALEAALEVMEFAYMGARRQPKEISQARAAIAKAKEG